MDDITLRLISVAYEAAAGETPWSAAVREIGSAFHASYAFLLVTDRRTGAPRWHVSSDIDPSFFRDYRDHFYACDVRSRYIREHGERAIFYDHLHSSDDEIRQDEYYNFLDRYGSRYYLAGNVLDADGVNASLSLHWPAPHGHVQADEIQQFTTFLPHVRRAVGMGRDIRRALAERDADRAMLSRIDTGVALIGEGGVVLFINEAGQSIVAAGDNLAIIDDRLRARRSSDDEALRRLLDGPGGTMALARPSGRRPFALAASRLESSESTLGVARPIMIVLVADPERSVAPPVGGLRDYFGFTPREAEIAALLASGSTIVEAAGHLGIASKTARLHLEHALKKSHANRQVDLVRLILGLKASLGALHTGT